MSEVKALFRAYYVMNLMFLPVVLGVVALWILSEHPPPGWAIAAYVMLALAAGILYLLRRALARIGASAMTINADGIDHWTWDFIPWSDIEDVELLRTKSLSTTTGSIDLLISGLSPGPEDLCAVAVALLEQSRQR